MSTAKHGWSSRVQSAAPGRVVVSLKAVRLWHKTDHSDNQTELPPTSEGDDLMAAFDHQLPFSGDPASPETCRSVVAPFV